MDGAPLQFAGERLGKLLWNPEQLPGADLTAVMRSLSGLTMQERMRELMRLRSDKVIPAGIDSGMLRELHDRFGAGVEQGLRWD
jgi:hypothetical protein